MAKPAKSDPCCTLDLGPLAASSLRFPADFLWGVSTAAHQVEGGNDNNQWSAWESAGRIKSGDRCGRACDWWSDAERDFDLAREIGVNPLPPPSNAGGLSRTKARGIPPLFNGNRK